MKKMISVVILIAGTGLLSTAVADGGRYQRSNVLDATGSLSHYTGAAWLIRTEDGVRGRIMSKVSTAADPYTLWIVVFNNPDACASTPCSEADLGNEAVNGSVFNGTGAISAESKAKGKGSGKGEGHSTGRGVVNMDFQIDAGGLPDGLFVLFGTSEGIAASAGYTAEIHLVVDKHPPIMPGMPWLEDLTTTNFPGMGPATNEAFAIFLGCPDSSCPPNIL